MRKLSLLAGAALLLSPFAVNARTYDLVPLSRESEAAEAARHKAIAEERMTDYFQYEYTMGTSSGKVTSAKASVIEILPVQGWPHRFRSSGKAYVEYFDPARRSFSRFTREFEVVTEEKSSGAIKVESVKVI
jgi:hypothetical protein